MKMKKGFTLIELLAVIIILAVIALIATPIVLDVIKDATRQANKNSVYGLLDGAKLYYTESLLDTNKSSNTNGTTNLIDEMKISGKKPNSGEIYINEKGQTALAVVYDDVCYKKDFDDTDITESEDIENCKVTGTTPLVTSYYEFGVPTTSSATNFQDVISSSKSNVFFKLEGEQLSVCIYKNNTLECFENNNYEEESEHIQNVFGTNTCSVDISELSCYDDVFYCFLSSDGFVECDDNGQFICRIKADGTASCS